MRLYRTTDVIKLKVLDIVFHISPLTKVQKDEIDLALREDPTKGAILTVRYCLRKVEGLILADGSDYSIDIENNMVTNDCVDDLMNIESSYEIVTACINLITGVPSEFIDPATGEKLHGVEIISNGTLKKRAASKLGRMFS